MRHWLLTNPGPAASLKLADAPQPAPGPGEVLVRIRACSLNYRDLMILRGEYDAQKLNPLVPLSDCAGEIAALGPGVDEFAKGERVIGQFLQNWVSGPLTQSVYGSDL